MPKICRLLVLSGVFLSLSVPVVWADDEKDLLDTVILSAGMTPLAKESAGRAYTIITGEQLQQNQVRSVTDALRQVPGLIVARTGAYGGLTHVRMRGAESNHVLVMIDGVEANNIATGEFDFGSLQAVDLERIEILRGPQSSFYGSNALAGVINIITKSGIRKDWRVTAQTEAGTHDNWLGGVLLQGGAEDYDLAVSASYRRTDGYVIAPHGSENKGDRNLTLNSKLNIDVNDSLALDATVRYVRHKVEIAAQDPDPQSPTWGWMIDADDWNDTDSFIGSLGFTQKSFDGALVQRGRISGNSSAAAYYIDGKKSSGNKGGRLTGSYQVSYTFDTPSFAGARHVLTGGVDWRREKFRATSPAFDPSQLEWKRRDNQALVSEYRVEFFDQLSFNAALRYDRNEDFSNAATYSLASAWRVPDAGTRFHASLGTGITNPTFYEQFGYIPATFLGNPDLKPEKSTGWDIGIEQGFFSERLIGDITYFHQDLTDEIATEYLPDFRYHPYNQKGKSKRQGIEVALTLDLLNGFTASAAYTWTDARDPDGIRRVRRPEHAGSVNVAYIFYEERARIFTEAVFNGRMRDLAFVPTLPPVVTLDPYTLVNMGGSFKVNDRLEIFARIENVFNEKYQEVFDFRAQGRSGYIGLRALL